MTNLRELIEDRIRAANGDEKAAAIAVCRLLNRELDLEGNGWFDNDPVMLDVLNR